RIRRYLAYVPEGPAIDWADAARNGLARWLDPLVAHVRQRSAFGLRIGPPVQVRRWSTATVKAALSDDAIARLGDLAPDATNPDGTTLRDELRELGWRQQTAEGGFTAGQPQYVFQLPLAGRDEDDLLKGFNQLWR